MQKGLLSGGDLVAGTTKEKQEGKACVSEDDLFQCFSCGACEYVCPVGIEHVGRKILDLRRGLVSEGRINSEKVAELFTTMERAPHNPWGIAHETRQNLLTSKQLSHFRRQPGMALLARLRIEFRSARPGGRRCHETDAGRRLRFLGRASP